MVLVLFAVIGCFVGYRLEMTRAGYVTMALTAVGFSAGQIVHLFMARSEAMTILPLVVGLVLVVFMLLGALLRLAIRGRTNA